MLSREKLKRNLWLSILLVLLSFKSFSQNDTVTTSIQLEKTIVKLVIKDLITGDEAKESLEINENKIDLLEQKIVIKDSIIFNYKNQLGNFESILNTKSNQLSLSQELSKRLEADLKKQKMKTKLMGGAGIVIAIGVAVLVN